MAQEPPKYTASEIRIIRWGEVVQLSPYRWQASWEIDLESIDVSRIDEVMSDAYEPFAGFEVELVVQGPLAIRAVIETTCWSMELDYYALTYQLFLLIDRRIGRIRLINDTPRDSWQPFRRT